MQIMKIPALLVAATALGLTACGGVKNPLERTLPDETQVIAGPSLSLPPSFELRPPRSGDANEAVLRAPGLQPVSGAGAEGWLVNRAQAEAGTAADANIRESLEAATKVDDSAAKEAESKKGLLQRWFGRK
jgi:hypothetical protein